MRAIQICTLLGSGLVLVASVIGCKEPTSFEGSAKFPGGAHGCFEKCASVGMDMASFVFVGEYSTACACQLRRVEKEAPASETDKVDTAMVAATAGVELERRRIAAQQAAAAGGMHPMVFVGH